MREKISTNDAPSAIGPYSQAIRAGDWVYCSGQIPLDPKTMTIVGTTAAEQAQQALENLGAVLAAAGASYADVVRCTVFLTDLGEFAAFNEVYARFMPDPPPARTTVQVSRLPRDVRVEVDAVAWLRRP